MFENREGNRVPRVTFHTRRSQEWVDVTGDEVFGGKSVVVFSLPGAFTPTCSSTHVPLDNFENTSMDGICAIGNVTGKIPLTPVAVAAGWPSDCLTARSTAGWTLATFPVWCSRTRQSAPWV
jgi:hypothetical protein